MPTPAATDGLAPYRAVDFAPRALEIARRDDGTLILTSPIPLGPCERSVVDLLARWAADAPDRVFLAQRDGAGGWERLTYAQAWRRVRGVGQGLLDRGLRGGDHLAILSGNSIENAVMMLGAMAVGVAAAPISPSYSLLHGGVARLAEIGQVLRPAMVFAQRLPAFEAARQVPQFADAQWVTAQPHETATPLAVLEAATPGPAFDAAFAAVNADTVAKILFTSGSTGSPKGVINTQGMLCASVAMAPLLTRPDGEPPVQVEWIPWHHTLGGNAMFNGVLRQGGSLYIDPGRPTPDGIAQTVAALREVSPTTMANVPAGYALLADALEADEELCRSFFRHMKRLGYGGAALPQPVQDRIQAMAVRTVGRRIAFVSGYGTTETAPTISVTHWPSEESGELGLPAPGLELKLLPDGERYELRVRGPNVTPGYLGRPDLTAEAFDEEGFYRVGDAVAFMDPGRPELGLRFAGRLSENFKLTTGVWVLCGDLRLAVLNAASSVLQDAVICGENRHGVGVLAWANPQAAAAYLSDPAAAADPARLARDPGLLAHLRQALIAHNARCASSARIVALRLLEEPPSLGAGEITDKAYVNQRAVLGRRAALVESLYAEPAPDGVLRL